MVNDLAQRAPGSKSTGTTEGHIAYEQRNVDGSYDAGDQTSSDEWTGFEVASSHRRYWTIDNENR